MTPVEAIAKWRGIKSLEDLDHEFKNDPEFYAAFQEAGRLAQASGDPKRKFWETDATGWTKKQFNVRVPPARPDERDESWEKRAKPIPGCAFPS